MLSYAKVLEIFDSYPELKRKDSTHGRVGYDYPGSQERQREVAREITRNQDGSVNGYINAKKLPESLRNQYKSALDERLFINIKGFTEPELRQLIELAMSSLGWQRNELEGKAWVNIDFPLRRYTIHQNLACTLLRKREQTLYKGVGVLLRDGGWLMFPNTEEAMEFHNAQYPHYEIVEHC